MGRMLKKFSSRSSTKKPSFFKLMIGDFEEKLRVPADFVKHFSRKLPRKSVLRSPTGRSWTIQVKKFGNDLFFSKGWHAFVNAHSLEYGDFLLFRYNGESRFKVKIYGRTGCEKEVHLNHVKPMSDVKKETHEDQWMTDVENEKEDTRKHAMEIKERSGAVVGASSIKTMRLHFDAIWNPHSKSRFMIPKRFVIKNGLTTKKSIVLQDPEGRSWPVDIYQREDGRVDMTKGWKTFCEGNRLTNGDTCRLEFLNRRKAKKVRVRIFRKVVVERPAMQIMLSNQPKAVHVATQAEKRAIKAASAFESQNPFFTLIMRPSFVQEACVMNVPAPFGKAYFMSKTHTVTLRVSDGRTWQLRCSYSGSQTKLLRCSDFVSDNNLKVGDVCVFELVDRKKFEMNISIFRVSQDVE